MEAEIAAAFRIEDEDRIRFCEVLTCAATMNDAAGKT
jgi:hypothetical protein